MANPQKRKWDAAGLALLGASFGLLVQVSHEFIEGVSAYGPDRQPMGRILAEVTVAALALALLFTLGAAVGNSIAQRRRIIRQPELAWNIRDFRYLGAILGIAPVILHEAVEILLAREPLETVPDPFLHLVSELLISGIGGELLFRGVAKIRNWGTI